MSITIKGNHSVFMSENFRCDENIIRFINEVCAPIFRYYGNTLSYSDQDDLIFAKQKPYENYVSPKVKLVLIDSSARKETEDDEKNQLPLRRRIEPRDNQ